MNAGTTRQFAEFTRDSVRSLATEALRRLKVTDTVELTNVAEAPYGLWFVSFADKARRRRWPSFDVGVWQTLDPEDAARVIRLELRNKLWICPLCQRRAEVRRLAERDAYRVECDACRTFDISGVLIGYFRRAHDADHEPVVTRLPQTVRLREAND